MVKTKSIFEKEDVMDGIRICVMRWVKKDYKYDKWLVDLAPSKGLLTVYRNKEITWNTYVLAYLGQMESKEELIAKLRKISDSGKTITLLCWEKTDKFCHRRLLKKLIDSCIVS